MTSARPRLLLVGAGHVHLPLLASALPLARAFDLTLLAPGPFWYSGMAPAVLAGQLPADAERVDVAALVLRRGGRYVQGLAQRLLPASRRVELADGGALAYDFLALDVGSTTRAQSVPGLAEHALAVKPISNLALLRARLEALARRPAAPDPLRIVIVGAGVSGCEIAATLERACALLSVRAELTLIGAARELAPHAAPRLRELLKAHLTRRGIHLRVGTRVRAVEPRRLLLEDGTSLAHDLIVDASGLQPPALLRESGLPIDEHGALRVDRHLRSPADACILGGGDCIAFDGRALPRAGVHAVKQAPVLGHNLLAMLHGRPLRAYRPQRRALLIVNLGDGEAVAAWGPLAWQGRAAYRLKDRIDRRFVRRLQA